MGDERRDRQPGRPVPRDRRSDACFSPTSSWTRGHRLGPPRAGRRPAASSSSATSTPRRGAPLRGWADGRSSRRGLPRVSDCSSRWGRLAAGRAAGASTEATGGRAGRRRGRSAGRSAWPATRAGSAARSSAHGARPGPRVPRASCGTPWTRSLRRGSSATRRDRSCRRAGACSSTRSSRRSSTRCASGVVPRTIIRPGAYVSHDARPLPGVCRRSRDPKGSKAFTLVPALEAWGQIVSVPEAGLAIANVGRRDVSFDLGMPVPTATAATCDRRVAGRRRLDRDRSQRPARVHPRPRRDRRPGRATGSPSGSRIRAPRSTSGT